MTDNGYKTMKILLKLTEAAEEKDKEAWFTASQITKKFRLKRAKPVMTISSYLTHLKREGLVERKASSDKKQAWWSLTKKGRKQIEKLVEA